MKFILDLVYNKNRKKWMTSAVMIDRRSVCVKEYEIKFNQSFTAQRTL